MRHDLKTKEQKEQEEKLQQVKDLKSAMKVITNYTAYKRETNDDYKLSDLDLQWLRYYIQWCMNQIAQRKKHNL